MSKRSSSLRDSLGYLSEGSKNNRICQPTCNLADYCKLADRLRNDISFFI